MIHARRPIWFDIDGTLLHTGEGVRAFGKALRAVYGWTEGLKDISFAGNTDLQVLRDLAANAE